MSDDEDYKSHPHRWEDLNQWGHNHPEEWEQDELLNNEELLRGIEAEINGREQAREEYDDDADEGHDDRIEKLRDTAQTVRNRIAYCKGEYQYDGDDGDNDDDTEDDDNDSDDEDENSLDVDNARLAPEQQQPEEQDGDDNDDEMEDMDIVTDSDSD